MPDPALIYACMIAGDYDAKIVIFAVVVTAGLLPDMN